MIVLDGWLAVCLEGIWKTSFCLEVVAQCVVHCTSSHYASVRLQTELGSSSFPPGLCVPTTCILWLWWFRFHNNRSKGTLINFLLLLFIQIEKLKLNVFSLKGDWKFWALYNDGLASEGTLCHWHKTGCLVPIYRVSGLLWYYIKFSMIKYSCIGVCRLHCHTPAHHVSFLNRVLALFWSLTVIAGVGRGPTLNAGIKDQYIPVPKPS